MGTYDTMGGSPRHDPELDNEPAIDPIEEEFLAHLEETQTACATYRAARAVLTEHMAQALCLLIKPGTVIDLRQSRSLPRCFWAGFTTTHGNADGTRIFRIESSPTVIADADHPWLSRWYCEATPISERAGQDMRGRLTETVGISGFFGSEGSPDGKTSANDLACLTVREAVEAKTAGSYR